MSAGMDSRHAEIRVEIEHLRSEIERLRTAAEVLAEFVCTAPGRLPERVTSALVIIGGPNARRKDG